jgi:hypothetical protein
MDISSSRNWLKARRPIIVKMVINPTNIVYTPLEGFRFNKKLIANLWKNFGLIKTVLLLSQINDDSYLVSNNIWHSVVLNSERIFSSLNYCFLIFLAGFRSLFYQKSYLFEEEEEVLTPIVTQKDEGWSIVVKSQY